MDRHWAYRWFTSGDWCLSPKCFLKPQGPQPLFQAAIGIRRFLQSPERADDCPDCWGVQHNHWSDLGIKRRCLDQRGGPRLILLEGAISQNQSCPKLRAFTAVQRVLVELKLFKLLRRHNGVALGKWKWKRELKFKFKHPWFGDDRRWKCWQHSEIKFREQPLRVWFGIDKIKVVLLKKVLRKVEGDLDLERCAQILRPS